MLSTTFLTTAASILAIATLSSALPTTPTISPYDNSNNTTSPSLPTPSTYYGITLLLRADAPINGGPAVWEPAPAQINQLLFLGNDTYISEIKFDHANNVDIDRVECRAYKDAAGVVPGSAPFTNAQPAFLSTELVLVESVLCYVTE